MFGRSTANALANVQKLSTLRDKVTSKRKRDDEKLEQSKLQRLEEIKVISGAPVPAVPEVSVLTVAPKLPMVISLLNVTDLQAICQLLRSVMLWSQYMLKHQDKIDKFVRSQAAFTMQSLKSIYFRERTRLGWFEGLTGKKSIAILWYIAMAQLNLIKCRHTVDVACAKMRAQDLPKVIDHDLALYTEPILEYTLIQCGMMLDLIIEDMAMRESPPDVIQFYELIELRLHHLTSFTWSEDIVNDPRYAHIISRHEAASFGMLNIQFMRDMEMANYYVRIPIMVRQSFMSSSPPIAFTEDELKRIAPMIVGIKRWLDKLARDVQSDALRREFREGMFERLLFIHEREAYETETNANKNIISEASMVLRLKRPDANMAVGITVMQAWADILDHHVDTQATAYTELVYRMMDYSSRQEYKGYRFLGNHVVLWTQIAQGASKILCPPHASQRDKWEKDTAYPFIFDYRKQPIVFMRTKKQSRICPDVLHAIAWWAICFVDHKKGILTNGCSILKWFDRINSPRDELVDSKKQVEFMPICALPPEMMAAATRALDTFNVERAVNERKASIAARKVKNKSRKKHDAEIKFKLDEKDRVRKEAELRLQDLEKKKEVEELKALRASIDARQAAEGRIKPTPDFSSSIQAQSTGSLDDYKYEHKTVRDSLQLNTSLLYDDLLYKQTPEALARSAMAAREAMSLGGDDDNEGITAAGKNFLPLSDIDPEGDDAQGYSNLGL